MNLIKLIESRKTMITYLQLKMDEQDWHGVADAAMDLREIDIQIRVFRKFGKLVN